MIFQTEEEDSIISTLPTLPLPLKPAYGALAGRIQTLTNRATLRFTLFDDLYDRAVSCYIQEGHEDILRAVWGKRAIVEGLISRDPQSGRPLSIRGVSNIRPIPEENGDYRKARGILPPPEGADKPEDIIRRMRDG